MPSNFYILQARPFLAKHEFKTVRIDKAPREILLSESSNSLGNGQITDIRDIIYVIPQKFDRLKTHEIAKEIGEFNDKITSLDRNYLLIGIGRWGTNEASLGIPITWSQISGADVIVEACLKRFIVEPSNGTHFFHNITACKNAYITISPDIAKDFIDWDWLNSLTATESKEYTRHLEFKKPLNIKVNGHTSQAQIFKPES